ncbi:MAG: hypothetical protein QM647_07375 [Asticcacaulis sp.]|uniref:hypothetical protein n=1 Tax=Asticcacaulis sp. TaxID=1872648 RepID=UPI0039E60D78
MTEVISFFTRRQGVNIAVVANYLLLAIVLVASSTAAPCEPLAARFIILLLWALVILLMAYISVTDRNSLWWMVPQIIALGLALLTPLSTTMYRSQISGDICFYNNITPLFEPQKPSK